MKNTLFLTFLIAVLLKSFCGTSQNYDAYFIGHSLIAHDMPTMLNQMAEESSINYSGSRQIINGAALKHQWERPEDGQVGNYQTDLAPGTGTYNTLVLTEAVPLINHITYSETDVMTENFYNYFYDHNPNGQIYIYETWHCINSGTPTGCDWDNDDDINWRQRLDNSLSDWEGIANDLNDSHPGTEVLIVPGGQAMANLYDAIENNEISGVNDISYFYSDDIHLTDIGSYYIACVMYATIFKQSPVGLSVNTTNEWGQPYESPGLVLGTKLQELALEAVCNYSRSGYDCSTLSTTSAEESSNLLITEIGDEIRIELKEDQITDFNIYDLQGRSISSEKIENQQQYSFSTDGHSKSIYILTIQTSSGKTIQKKIVF